jgi:Kef-type K+ transport system membrane component KefB
LSDEMPEETGWCMPSLGASLFWIIGCAVVAPLFAGLVPRKLVPEVVLLLAAGIVIGPSVLDIAVEGSEISHLRDLGLGLLFLLAGYEIDTDEITGRGGRHALITWLVCLAAAFGVVLLLGATGAVHAQTAVASEPGVLVAFVALIAGTGLPVIVAVTGVAVESGDMTAANASVLVAAGAITVLLFPLGASLINRSAPGTGPLGPAEATDRAATSDDKPRS